MRRARSVRATTAAAALLLAMAPLAFAEIPPEVQVCRRGIVASAASLFQRGLNAVQKCQNKLLQGLTSCPPPGPTTKIASLEQALREGITRTCGPIVPLNLLGPGYLNYPGPCVDPTPSDGFSLSDLQSCMISSHEEAIDRLVALEYNTQNQLGYAALHCQKTIAKNGGKFAVAKLKAIQKCRNAIDRGQLQLLPGNCETENPTTVLMIENTATKVRAGILTRCTETELSELGICSSAACAPFCATCDASCVATCILATHGTEVSDPDPGVTDLVDFEYPPPSPGANCGDGTANQLAEECDGADDGTCPGKCGAPDSFFPCLCLDRPRERVIEHAQSDLDTGWTGLAHDFALVEGGGYFLDLYDCDGPQGPDTLCTVGPSCSEAPHPTCSKDADCATIGLGTCRKRATAVGPHCNSDVQQSCVCNISSTTAQPACIDTAHCSGTGDFCIQQFHTPPLPLSAGGVPVCVVNVFTDDIVGTKDLATGSMALRLRQKSIVQLTGTPSQPCPVCGGFCKAPQNDLSGRHHCTTNADCADTAEQTCILYHVCSFGPNQDQACRPDPPAGGPTPLFGNTSIDCPPPLSSAGILDITFNPQSTETVSLTPSVQCNTQGFAGKTCLGGTNQGASCTTASECPAGSCEHQCFCPAVGGVPEKPNECDPACVGGSNDAEPCSVDGECPGGFCHPADCRPDPTAPLSFQPNEGACTATVEGRCSYSAYRGCVNDTDCAPPTCVHCQAGETCSIVPKNCYINSGITRSGTASTTDPVLSAIFCIAATGQSAVDSTAGLPGPGAIRQPSTVIDTGFNP